MMEQLESGTLCQIINFEPKAYIWVHDISIFKILKKGDLFLVIERDVTSKGRMIILTQYGLMIMPKTTIAQTSKIVAI